MEQGAVSAPFVLGLCSETEIGEEGVLLGFLPSPLTKVQVLGKGDLRTQSAMAGRNGKVYSSRIRACWTAEEGDRERNKEGVRERERGWREHPLDP